MNMFTNNIEAVVIGASAGGIEALDILLSALPETFSLPIIIVLHIPGGMPSLLTNIFESKVKLKVKEAVEKEYIEGGTIYFSPPGYHLLIEKDKTFSLSNEEPVRYSRPSIDILFESAADAYGDKLAGILLTGANEDGALGLKKIKESGGLTIVQNPTSAKIAIMPTAGMPYASPECVMSLQEIANFLKIKNQATKGRVMLTDKFEVLIVDDVKNNLIALNALLANENVNITQAQSGDEALGLMLVQDFGLALLDVQMPGMSGFELAEFMRGINKTKNIPIIFVTGSEKNHQHDFKGSEIGVVDYLQKPLDPDALRSKVKKYLKLHQQQKKL